jgi:hypothetical protein
LQTKSYLKPSCLVGWFIVGYPPQLLLGARLLLVILVVVVVVVVLVVVVGVLVVVVVVVVVAVVGLPHTGRWAAFVCPVHISVDMIVIRLFSLLISVTVFSRCRCLTSILTLSQW